MPATTPLKSVTTQITFYVVDSGALAMCWAKGPEVKAYRHWSATASIPTSADAGCCPTLPVRSANKFIQEAITLLPGHHRMYDFREAIPEAVLSIQWTVSGGKRQIKKVRRSLG